MPSWPSQNLINVYSQNLLTQLGTNIDISSSPIVAYTNPVEKYVFSLTNDTIKTIISRNFNTFAVICSVAASTTYSRVNIQIQGSYLIVITQATPNNGQAMHGVEVWSVNSFQNGICTGTPLYVLQPSIQSDQYNQINAFFYMNATQPTQPTMLILSTTSAYTWDCQAQTSTQISQWSSINDYSAKFDNSAVLICADKQIFISQCV